MVVDLHMPMLGDQSPPCHTIRPALPGEHLNNWDEQDILRIRKFW